MVLANELIEGPRTHACGKRSAISTLNFDILVIAEKICQKGDYDATRIWAIYVVRRQAISLHDIAGARLH